MEETKGKLGLGEGLGGQMRMRGPLARKGGELKRKALETSKGAGESLSEKRSLTRGPSSKYTPAGLDAPRQPTPAERRANSSVLNQAPPPHRPPPPPPLRRTTLDDSGAGAPPAKAAALSRPTAPSARFGGSTPAAAPPAPPARKYGAQPPLPPCSNSASSNSAAPPTPPRNVASPPHLPSTHRPIPAPPYQHAIANDLPQASPPPRAPPAQQPVATAKFKLFSQYGQADKDEFFLMMDQFFEAKLRASPSARADQQQQQMPVFDEPALPPVALSTRPTLSRGPTSTSAGPSYPPPQSHSSSALSILHYILYEPYTTAWYSLPTPTPPPLAGRSDIRWTGSWTQTGDQKSLVGFCLFGDCSTAWWKIGWSASEEKRGQLDSSRMTREGRYRPIPAPWDGEKLYAASERYGTLLVDFAEQAVASRKPVARGECWDVAAEALNSVATSLPKPFPSIGRTHGHLIFYGKAGGKGEGVWRGGDAYVRPGDVVEWRTVTIREVGMQVGAYATLGDPDHTAVITAVGSPTSTPVDGQPYPIAALVSLTVVEQSQGALPVEKTYDLAAMSKGELWIYRPVGLVEYCGSEIAASWPPSCESWQVGELE